MIGKCIEDENVSAPRVLKGGLIKSILALFDIQAEATCSYKQEKRQFSYKRKYFRYEVCCSSTFC